MNILQNMNTKPLTEKLYAASRKATESLTNIAHSLLLTAGLITNTYSHRFSFSNRDEALYCQHKLALLLIKEIRQRMPFLSSLEMFPLATDRRCLKIYVARDWAVLDRYFRVISRNILGGPFFTFNIETTTIWTGYTPTGAVQEIIVSFRDITNNNRNRVPVVNPYYLFLRIHSFLKILTTLMKYAPVKIELQESEINEIVEIQSFNFSLNKKIQEGTIAAEASKDLKPVNVSSILPIFETERMRRKNERAKYGVPLYNGG